jgi:hypothetical protein
VKDFRVTTAPQREPAGEYRVVGEHLSVGTPGTLVSGAHIGEALAEELIQAGQLERVKPDEEPAPASDPAPEAEEKAETVGAKRPARKDTNDG